MFVVTNSEFTHQMGVLHSTTPDDYLQVLTLINQYLNQKYQQKTVLTDI